MLAEVFSNESSMALVRFWLAAQEASFVNKLRRYKILDVTFNQQLAKLPFVAAPINVFFLVGVKDFLCWRQFWFVDVRYACNLFQEILEVLFFCEAGQLRYVVQTDVNHGAYAGFFQRSEELACALLGETEGKYSGFHFFVQCFTASCVVPDTSDSES